MDPGAVSYTHLISDGLPNATRYFGSYATADLKKIKEKLGKKGILFQAAAIGWDKEAIRKIYGNAYLDISSLEPVSYTHLDVYKRQ